MNDNKKNQYYFIIQEKLTKENIIFIKIIINKQNNIKILFLIEKN